MVQRASEFKIEKAYEVFQEVLRIWPMWNSQLKIAGGRWFDDPEELGFSVRIEVCHYHMDREALKSIIDLADQHNMTVGFPNGTLTLRPKEQQEGFVNDEH